MSSPSFTDWFVAPETASEREVRLAGLRSFVVGGAVITLMFIFIFVARRNGGAGLTTPVRLIIAAGSLTGYVLTIQGLYRLITGVARGALAEKGLGTSTLFRMFFGAVAFVSCMALLFAIFASMEPQTVPSAVPPPSTAERTISVPIDMTATSQRINLGNDVVITIEAPNAQQQPSHSLGVLDGGVATVHD